MSQAVKSACRNEQGDYESPFGKLAKFERGTLFDYTCGTRSLRYGQQGFEQERALYDVVAKQSWTVAERRKDVVRIAATLLSVYKLKPGDHVMICFPTSAVFALLCFACARAGLVMALANPAYTADEMKHACSLVGAKAVLTVEQFLPSLGNGAIDMTDIVDASYPSGSGDKIKNVLFRDLVQDVDEAEAILKRSRANEVDWKSPCGIFFSSGTTGLPKAVMVSHYNLIALCHAVGQIPGYSAPAWWNKGKPGNSVVYLPAFHIAGMAGMTIGALEGACVYFAVANPIDLKLIVSTIREARPYRNTIVPPLLLALTRLGLAGPQGLEGSLFAFYSAAAPCGEGLQREAEEKLKIKIGQYWGLSETTGAVTGSDLTKDTKAGSCGQVLAGMQMRIVGEDGSTLPHGKAGEIWMKGPMNMIGYYRNEKATAETLDKDGWLHTGDVGYMDDEGYLFIVDRIKELIKYKGFQVAPAELEGLLLSHPHVMDAGVTGVDDGNGKGEAPRAFVVLRPDAPGAKQVTLVKVGQSARPSDAAIAKEIAGYVAERVSNYKQLRGGVVFVSEIPKK